ncbi:hypothetical protein BU14_0077s0058 [Porphyra umbilicalis]|uniref:Uncharacterized protein n=1 Tax=Porphyra umbilicalis TaxID=2786 RepID=A0A1X6PF21_PORUM|nr:hypothetical protein BU14_0077s0058 [Porphyra umbilicalis]|eukprot:OSX79438.1 hypothetical protein BU14_0077s0058 [Porphyra umbilicalis]
MDAPWAARHLAHPRVKRSDAVRSHDDGGNPVLAPSERPWRCAGAVAPSPRRVAVGPATASARVRGSVLLRARAWRRRADKDTSAAAAATVQVRVSTSGHCARCGAADASRRSATPAAAVVRPGGRRVGAAVDRRLLVPGRSTGLEGTNDADVAVAVFILQRGGKMDARLALCAADCARVSPQRPPRCS